VFCISGNNPGVSGVYLIFIILNRKYYFSRNQISGLLLGMFMQGKGFSLFQQELCHKGFFPVNQGFSFYTVKNFYIAVLFFYGKHCFSSCVIFPLI